MPLPPGVKIREPRRGGSDRDWIYRLLAEKGVNVPPTDQSNTLTWVVSHPESEIFVAVDASDRGVGLLALSHRPQLRVGGRIATVDEFIVAPNMRRRGIGTALLEKALARARMLGCKRVETNAGDASAKTFLEKRGFAPSGAEMMGWRNVDGK
jgi:GNAT superfamily N-acetyltransferase